MEVEIISKESIKPSSPTPPHLKTFKLCLLDQIVITPFVPTILYYYPTNNGVDDDTTRLQDLERLVGLKKSLSETLTRFYPLAGTIRDNLAIDCDDIGAFYVVALVRRHLHEFLRNPDHLRWINKLLPCQPSFNGSSAGTRVTNVQVNVFECGGMAISLCVSHKILDGAGLGVFLKGWTSMARGAAKEAVYPNLTSPSLFPAKDSLWLRNSSMAMCGSWLKEGKCSTRRFVFYSDAIAMLKAKAAQNGLRQPTRVEAVSALIWKCAMAASKAASGVQKPSRLTHMVNLRRNLAATTWPENLICNLIWIATAAWGTDGGETTLHGLVNKVHESISRIDVEFVNEAQGDKGYVAMQKSVKEIGEIGSKGSIDNYCFTSWCKMGFYDIDFGWGKPIWVTGIVGDGSPVFMNLVTLMDTKCGEGIEAWINLDEPEMAILQGDPELLAYASLDPSPLPNGEINARIE